MIEPEDHDKANRLFDGLFKGRGNFLTPDVLERGMINPHRAYELSRGRVFMRLDGEFRDYIWGVSIVDEIEGEVINDRDRLTGAFYNLQEARDYIKSLQEKTQ